MPGIEDRLAKIKAIQAEAEAKKTAEKETKDKESAEKRTGLEQEKAQVEGELASATDELQKNETGLAEINAMDLSALDDESRAAIESELVGIKEEMENLSSKVAELTKRKQEIDEMLKGGVDTAEKTLDDKNMEVFMEPAIKEDPELTKLGKDAGMIDAIHGFKFVLEQNLAQTIVKAVKNPQAVDIKALDFAITAGTERIAQLKQSPESILQDLKNWAEFGDSRLTSKTKQKIKDLEKLPQESLDTIVKIFQARVDDARLLKQKEEEKNHA